MLKPDTVSDSGLDARVAAEPPMRLLLVEDDPVQRMMMERTLSRAGYSVMTAADGAEALCEVASGAFQIMVTDWEMPKIDGTTLCRQTRLMGLQNYLYILLLTVQSSPTDVVAALDAGADDYLRKPASEPELLARLNAGQRIIRLERSLKEAQSRIEVLSVTDPLTGAFNRRYLDESLNRAIAQAVRYGRPLSVVMCDLDRFKSVNDHHGHQAGDEVLQQFTHLVRQLLRASDWVARFGGEEFVLVLPEADLNGAMITAEKIRAALEKEPLVTCTGALPVTASFGASSLDLLGANIDPRFGGSSGTREQLLRRADAALYRSKREGRNRVTAG